MSEKYLDGDYVLIFKFPFLKYFLKVGHDVVFIKEPHGLMLKRIASINDDKTFNLKGLSKNSISPDLLKSINIRDIKGVVIYHFK